LIAAAFTCSRLGSAPATSRPCTGFSRRRGVDIRKYFDSIDHERLREVLHGRIRDGVLQRLIGKWLNAGVLEEGAVTRSESGSPQGGVVSPVLANIFLHAALDVWFHRDVRARLRGQAHLVRYADVGTAALGVARWGQLDLGGYIWQWNLDWYATYITPCTDCADLTTPDGVQERGVYPARMQPGASTNPTFRFFNAPANRGYGFGFRCARSP
jgi:hypothetical protein